MLQSLRYFRRSATAVIGCTVLILIHLFAALGPVVHDVSHEATDPSRVLQGPSRQFPLGTDEVGRDVFARLLQGTRISLLIAWTTVLISVAVGTVLGSLAGFFGGVTDVVITRVTDAFLSVPIFFVLLAVLSLFGANLLNVIVVMGLTAWMSVARLVRSEVLRVRTQPFIEAALAMGSSPLRLIIRHVLPQAIPSVIVAATLGSANAILTESALSYLGLGIQPPGASLGTMLRNAQDYVWSSPALAVYPGAVIFMIVLSVNWFGDGLRDATDPRLVRSV